MHRLVLVSLAMALASPLANAAGLDLHIGDYNNADWTLLPITDDGPAEANMVIDASLGNPGSHWVISYALPRTTGTFTAQNRLGAFYTALAYDPAVSGALQTLAFSMDVSSLSTSFAFDSIGQLRPALLQDGVVYTVINDDLIPSKSPLGVYQTRQWSFDAVASDWVTAVAGSSQRPDFGAGASPIFTGFRFAMGTNCSGASGCAPASAFLSVDNFSATLTPVPEPSTWLLLGAGLGCLALRRRT